MAAKRNVARRLVCVDAEFRLEPLPVGIDRRHQRDRHAADLNRKRDQVVETSFDGGVELSVGTERREAFGFVFGRGRRDHGRLELNWPALAAADIFFSRFRSGGASRYDAIYADHIVKIGCIMGTRAPVRRLRKILPAPFAGASAAISSSSVFRPSPSEGTRHRTTQAKYGKYILKAPYNACSIARSRLPPPGTVSGVNQSISLPSRPIRIL